MKNLLVIPLIIFTFISSGQERCSTEEYQKILEEKYPKYRNDRMKVNHETEQWIQNNSNYKYGSIITVPVVVHVVWNTNAENISDAQINSQITILNNDFRRTNADAINTPSVWSSVAADTEIEFCLASIDPQGNSTTGITRTQTSLTSFSIQGDEMKSTSQGGIDAWPNEDYLNIWVCDLGGGLLGYATPPSNFLSNEDGVVINYKYFGNIGTAQAPYNKGRTATHEVGHWLNLDHIWGNGWGSCGNDNISDTPVQEEENYSCPGFPHNPNSCGTSNQNGDMFMNYMDYTNDACMNLFTQGQKTRMISAINQYRSNLLNHNLCNSTPPTPSWNCINGSCMNPGNGTGNFTNYNNCLNNCFCTGNISTINETFQLSSIPNNWTIDNPDNSTTWEITNSAGYNSSSSIFINNADYSANGEYDDLTLPILDFSSASSINLDFNYAYTLWTNPNSTTGGAPWSDTLKILISDDCGQSWTNLWEKSGSNLATTTPVYNGFAWTPSNSSDWNYENINLNNYAFQDGITIKFRNINDFENNLFLDNINISTTNTDVDEILLDNKIIYPNPTEGIINININGIKTVYNILGEKIISSDSNILDLKDITEGIYFIHVKSTQYKIIKY